MIRIENDTSFAGLEKQVGCERNYPCSLDRRSVRCIAIGVFMGIPSDSVLA